MTWVRRPFWLFSAAAVTIAATLPAQAATASGWALAFQEHYGAAANYSSYYAVAAPDNEDVWAFGTTGAQSEQANSPVAVEYTGGSWQDVTLPALTGSYVTAASASSASNVWAVTDGNALDALEWNGTGWSLAHSWDLPGSEITGVTALSPTDVWVFGAGGATGGIGTWNFNGTTWTQVGGAAAGILDASALSSSNIWAVGSNGQAPDNRVVHYSGGSWHRLSSSLFDAYQLTSVAALSAKDVWVAGSSPFAHRPGVLVNYNGTTWTAESVPWKVQFRKVVSDGAGGLWFIVNPTANPASTWLLHRSATGTWSRVFPSPAGSHLEDLALVGGTTTVTGVGEIAETQGSNAAVYQDGSLGG